jgi:hypothetical protein
MPLSPTLFLIDWLTCCRIAKIQCRYSFAHETVKEILETPLHAWDIGLDYPPTPLDGLQPVIVNLDIGEQPTCPLQKKEVDTLIVLSLFLDSGLRC